MKKTKWPGNWKVVCDVCGFWFPSSEVQKRWDGLIVCSKDFESRHPQTLYNYRHHVSVPDFVKKELQEIFVHKCTIESSSGYADLAEADCARADWNNISYKDLQDLLTNGHEE